MKLGRGIQMGNRLEKLVASRWIPEGSSEIKGENCVAYVRELAGKSWAMGYIGNAAKPHFHHTFKSPEARDKYVDLWMKGVAVSEQYKADRLAERKTKMSSPHNLKVGDVLHGSWGYDQTNPEYWQVTKLIGKRMVEISELCLESEETGFMSGQCVPLPGKFTGKVKRSVVNESGSVRLYDYCHLSKEEPRDVAGVKVYRSTYWSSYA
jgi:hypothetical protein